MSEAMPVAAPNPGVAAMTTEERLALVTECACEAYWFAYDAASRLSDDDAEALKIGATIDRLDALFERAGIYELAFPNPHKEG